MRSLRETRSRAGETLDVVLILAGQYTLLIGEVVQEKVKAVSNCALKSEVIQRILVPV